MKFVESTLGIGIKRITILRLRTDRFHQIPLDNALFSRNKSIVMFFPLFYKYVHIVLYFIMSTVLLLFYI